MPLDLTGIQNVGEFHSRYYLDAMLKRGFKGLFAHWRKVGDQEGKMAHRRHYQ